MKSSLYLLIINSFFIIIYFPNKADAQNLGINSTGALAHPSAILDIDASPSNNKGFAMPSLTTAQRLAIASPKNGLQVYDTNLYGFYYFNTLTNKWDCVSNPAGTIQYFANATAPIGYLACDGNVASRNSYPELFNAIGTLYGVGDGVTTFNLPDLRGEFIRGIDNGRGADPGRLFGSFQPDEFKSHNHTLPSQSGGVMNLESLVTSANNDEGLSAANLTGNTGGNETRPRNVALLPCIKY